MTSTYTVEHENGPSTIEGVHAFWFPAGHLVFLNEEGNTFAGFAAGTWHSFKKVEAVVEDAPTNPYPVGARVKSTRDLAEFEVVQGGASHVVYESGSRRPGEYQHYSDLNLMPEYTEFKVIA